MSRAALENPASALGQPQVPCRGTGQASQMRGRSPSKVADWEYYRDPPPPKCPGTQPPRRRVSLTREALPKAVLLPDALLPFGSGFRRAWTRAATSAKHQFHPRSKWCTSSQARPTPSCILRKCAAAPKPCWKRRELPYRTTSRSAPGIWLLPPPSACKTYDVESVAARQRSFTARFRPVRNCVDFQARRANNPCFRPKAASRIGCIP